MNKRNESIFWGGDCLYITCSSDKKSLMHSENTLFNLLIIIIFKFNFSFFKMVTCRKYRTSTVNSHTYVVQILFLFWDSSWRCQLRWLVSERYLMTARIQLPAPWKFSIQFYTVCVALATQNEFLQIPWRHVDTSSISIPMVYSWYIDVLVCQGVSDGYQKGGFAITK